MASARKKQDEKNLKILRELVSLPGNKHCFDCNQRGPTYVNMTIGSFVCTKCSGMLRGLTPPHRVKSISMASFTSEEVDLVKSRGNDTCRSTWLALYDQNYSDSNTSSKDEQHVKDFMIDKYERKRYYHDKGLRNGSVAPPATPPQPTPRPTPATPVLNGNVNGNKVAGGGAGDDFVADFGSADIFSASHFNNNVTQTTGQPSFANFDNNVIFNSAIPAAYPSSYDLLVSQLQLSQMQVPRYAPTSRWNMTSPPTQNGFSGLNGSSTNGLSPGGKAPPPSEDRYAALKDLDNALKSQQQHEQHQQQQQQQQHQQQQQQQQQQHQHIEWGSNGSGYASPSPLYGSPNTSGSMYGSPSQGTFMSAFHQQQDTPSNISNPFTVNGVGARNPWTSNGNANMNNTVVANNCFNNTAAAFSSSPNTGGGGANPFRDNFTTNTSTAAKFNGAALHNGFNGFQHQQNLFPVNNHSSHFSKPWANPNPFTLGVSPGAGGASNNPFL